MTPSVIHSQRLTHPESDPELCRLLASQREGYSLTREFYTSPDVYERDLDAIWRQGWLFAAHSCELPKPGDFVTLDVGPDPIVVIRAEDGKVHALHNVCRHRGSVVCTESCGHVTKLVCPYHQWAYGLDGRLVAWRGMQESLRKEDFGLAKATACEVEGLIFIHLSPNPSPFETARDCLTPLLKPQGFRNAKVAKSVDYLVPANWKLVWENNRECYHCNVNHPQYIKANFDHYNADDTSARIREEMAEATQRTTEKWASQGIPTHNQTGMTTFPDAERGIWFSANRTPLVEGWVTESMDGRQVAPFMGDYNEAEVGTLRIRTLPNFWNHSGCDHGVSTRLLPAGPTATAIRVWWLVDENAVEGRDYSLAKLMPFWQLTSEQDWLICERQQKGVGSKAYRPGPYSTYKEYNVQGFIQWYLKNLDLSRVRGA